MKKTILALALTTISLGAFAQAGTLKLEGQSNELGDTVTILTRTTFKNPAKVVAKNGKFSTEVKLDKIEGVAIMWQGKTANDRGQRFAVLGVPGEKAVLTTEGTHYYISGSKFYKESDALDRATENMQEASQVTDYLLNYLKQNPKSEAPVRLLSSLDYDGLVKVTDALSPEVRNGRFKSYIDMRVTLAKKQHDADEAAAKKQAAGIVAPDFTLNDLNGKPLSLSSLRGKYVLLDFWGSWCIWCIKGMPQMKEYYNKYKGKFEIVGVDCNDTDAKWHEAVKKYELPWLHVYNPRDSKLLDDYGIQGFPTKILIGPDGKIVKTIVGEDPAFYTFLDETFGK
jgi:thiol-disulfide isomerase/thioredoxin